MIEYKGNCYKRLIDVKSLVIFDGVQDMECGCYFESFFNFVVEIVVVVFKRIL